jgi:predicted TIM-barrel fold metal-dependent hydrolase
MTAFDQVHGRIIDVDAHAMFMPDAYVPILGDAYGEPLRAWATSRVGDLDLATLQGQRSAAKDNVFRAKGWLAHGADDARDRVDALDRMGIDRQIVFPPVPLPFLHAGDDEAGNARERWNDAMLEWASVDPRRVVPAMQLGLCDVDRAIAEARRLVGRGGCAVEVAFARPPGGRSPADPAWDPLWAVLAEHRVPLLLHVGGGGLGGGFGPARSFTDPRWGATDRLRISERPDQGADLDPRDPGYFATLGPIDRVVRHHAAETFVSALILGGVLDRLPDLRVGVIELGAGWVASWAEQMDMAAPAMRAHGLAPLAEAPSSYLRRQVRITPTYGEPVGQYVERSALDDVFAFSTDYPHYEGGKDPMGWSARALAGADDEVVEKWFVTNGSLLFSA